MVKLVSFNRPGTASSFIQKAGIAQLWMTSFDVVIRRIGTPTGRTMRLSTASRRGPSASVRARSPGAT